jgi:hypothetical protein
MSLTLTLIRTVKWKREAGTINKSRIDSEDPEIERSDARD